MALVASSAVIVFARQVIRVAAGGSRGYVDLKAKPSSSNSFTLVAPAPDADARHLRQKVCVTARTRKQKQTMKQSVQRRPDYC